jgi:hypothetical protein
MAQTHFLHFNLTRKRVGSLSFHGPLCQNEWTVKSTHKVFREPERNCLFFLFLKDRKSLTKMKGPDVLSNSIYSISYFLQPR